MSDQAFSLWDSAIKIGLGALIGAFGTLAGLLLTHKHEHKKELRRRMADSLERIVEQFTAVHNDVTSFGASVLCWHDARKAGKVEQAATHKEDALSEGKRINPAVCTLFALSGRLKLLGFFSVARQVDDYGKAVGALVSTVNEPNEKEANTHAEKLRTLEHSIIAELSKSYTERK